MTQYVVQIQDAANGVGIGWLAKSFEVTVNAPIPVNIPSNRTQALLTNTISFNGIVAVYNQYTMDAIFSYDQVAAKINCTGATTGSWPID